MTIPSINALFKKPPSLVELMIISVIITIVITIIGQKFLGFDDDSKLIQEKQNIRSIEGALNVYFKDTGTYPTTEQSLKSLVSNPLVVTNWDGPYISEDLIVDPWGNYYQYKLQEGKHTLFSQKSNLK